MVAPARIIRSTASARSTDSTRAQTWLAGTSAPDLIRILASAGCRVVGRQGQQASDAPATVIVIVENDELPSAFQLRRRYGLTVRESETVLMLADRMTNKELAAALGVSQKTAWRHTENALRKLHVTSRKDVRPLLIAAFAEKRRAAA